MADTMALATDTYSLAAAASTTAHVLGRDGVAPGRITGIEDGGRRQIFIYGTFSATCKISASMDNSNWYDVLTGITSSKYYEFETPAPYVRVTCTAYTSGTIEIGITKAITDNIF